MDACIHAAFDALRIYLYEHYKQKDFNSRIKAFQCLISIYKELASV